MKKVGQKLARDRSDAEHLAITIVAARRAGGVTGDRGAALAANVQLGFLPAIRKLTHFLLRLGLSALRVGHGR